MPEGHSVHRLAQQFQDVFAGSRLALSSPQGKFAAGAAALDGHVLERAQAHGKQLFLYFSNDLVLRVHLGLYGAWDFGGDQTFNGASSIGAPRRIGEREIQGPDVAGSDVAESDVAGSDVARSEPAAYAGPPEPKGAVRVRLVSEHGWADLRGASACQAMTLDEVAQALAKLGPDPLHNIPGDGAEFARRLTRSSTPVALLLMKQDVLAGVGNVYRAEVLFRQKLDPMLEGRSVSGTQAAALWEDIVSVMADGVRDGRIITTLPMHRASVRLPVPVEDAHYVYKRNGLPCRLCGTIIALTELGGRKLYWCPGCQGS